MKIVSGSTLIILLCCLHFCDLKKVKFNPNDIALEYKHTVDFEYYFKNTFRKSLSNIDFEYLFVIPISSCTPCVDNSIAELKKNKFKNTIVVFVGETSDIDRLAEINLARSKYISFLDSESELYHYETNIGKPTLLIPAENGLNSITLNSDDWPLIYDYLNKCNLII